MKSREISRSKIGPFSLACTDPYIGIGWEYQSNLQIVDLKKKNRIDWLSWSDMFAIWNYWMIKNTLDLEKLLSLYLVFHLCCVRKVRYLWTKLCFMFLYGFVLTDRGAFSRILWLENYVFCLALWLLH